MTPVHRRVLVIFNMRDISLIEWKESQPTRIIERFSPVATVRKMQQETIIPILFGLGLMSLLASLFGIFERKIERRALRSVALGVVFGAGAVFAMWMPARIVEGIIVDSRAIIVGLAAAFGGWRAGLIATVMASGYRLNAGGIGMIAGACGICVSAAMGIIWSLWIKPSGRIPLRSLAFLGVLISMHVVTIAVLPLPLIVVLLKGAVPSLVIGSVIGAVILGTLIERERKYIRTERMLAVDAYTDALTQISNRRHFEKAVAAAIDGSLGGREHALMIIDIDHFKRINDTYGHDEGDTALKFVAGQIRRVIAGKGTFCRFGGEEFAVFLGADQIGAAETLAESIRQSIYTNPLVLGSDRIGLSVSIGVAVRGDSDHYSFAKLYRVADAALYRAKLNGRNLVVFDHGENTVDPKKSGRRAALLQNSGLKLDVPLPR